MAVPTNGICDDDHHGNAGIQTEEILQCTVQVSTENGEQENLPYAEEISVEHAHGDDTSIRDADSFQYTVEVSNGDDELPWTGEVTAEEDDLLTQDPGSLPYTAEVTAEDDLQNQDLGSLPYTVEVTAEDEDLQNQDLGNLPYTVEVTTEDDDLLTQVFPIQWK